MRLLTFADHHTLAACDYSASFCYLANAMASKLCTVDVEKRSCRIRDCNELYSKANCDERPARCFWDDLYSRCFPIGEIATVAEGAKMYFRLPTCSPMLIVFRRLTPCVHNDMRR